MSRIVDVEPLDCLAWKDGEHGTTFDDGVLWVLEKIGELPSVQPEKRTEERTETRACDCISRQAAIAVADSSDYVGLSVEDAKKVADEVAKGLKRLPSAEPQSEIVRCKDCKHMITHEGYGYLGEPAYTCEGNMEGWVLPDSFCSHAERKDATNRSLGICADIDRGYTFRQKMSIIADMRKGEPNERY